MAEEGTTVVEHSTKKKKEKKERKKEEKKRNKKRKKLDDGDDTDGDQPIVDESSKEVGSGVENSEGEESDKDKKSKKKKMKEAKSRLKSKKEEKAELMTKVPLTDGDGIAYTKFQIRQMLKRVKKGLPPVATPKEIDEKRQNEARLRREEEAELAGLTSTRNTNDSDEDSNEASGEDDDDNAGNDDIKMENENEISNDDDDAPAAASKSDVSCSIARDSPAVNEDGSTKKKAKRNKIVPSDYVCQACKNRHKPAHWIYDCPDKVTVRGTNKKRKKERGINDPDSKKVFVSGLPFEAKTKAVEDFFAVTKNCGTVASVRLITFEDTKRCNGQAYVCFDTDAGAQRALGLSGTTIDAEALSSSDGKDSRKDKKKDEETPAKRKELKLKVSKVLNRRKTKRG